LLNKVFFKTEDLMVIQVLNSKLGITLRVLVTSATKYSLFLCFFCKLLQKFHFMKRKLFLVRRISQISKW